MASLAISASLQTVCSSHQATKKQQPKSRPAARSLGTKEATHHVVALDVKAQNGLNIEKQEKSALRIDGPEAEDAADYKSQHGLGTELPLVKSNNERWKKGTWDLNMFSKDGKLDWDGIILAGALL